jgi:hypothetical protein
MVSKSEVSLHRCHILFAIASITGSDVPLPKRWTLVVRHIQPFAPTVTIAWQTPPLLTCWFSNRLWRSIFLGLSHPPKVLFVRHTLHLVPFFLCSLICFQLKRSLMFFPLLIVAYLFSSFRRFFSSKRCLMYRASLGVGIVVPMTVVMKSAVITPLGLRGMASWDGEARQSLLKTMSEDKGVIW